jgi:hypothetical protein
MHRGLVIGCAIVALGLAGCAAEKSNPSGAAKSSNSGIVLSAAKPDTVTHQNLGRQIGGTTDNTVGVDTKGPTLGSSMIRGLAHVAYADTPASAEARAAFTGSGESSSDLLRPAKRPIDPKRKYIELLYGYLAAIDPGGTVESTVFYVDDNGCETDVITRRSKDGAVRQYFVDTTGWQDQISIEMGDPINRSCAR